MAGEIQLNSTTMATESSGTITLSNVNSATNRTNLGLGSMATQNANAVAITGGTINTIQPATGQSLTIKDEDGNTAITVGTDNTAAGYLSLNFGSYHGDSGGAGSGSLTANTLNDYEIGSWSPDINSETSGSGRVTSITEASYIKIGRSVTVSCVVSLTTLGSGGSGRFFLKGLPFTALDYAGVAVGLFAALNSALVNVAAIVRGGSTNISFLGASSASIDPMGDLTFSTYAKAGTTIYLAATYQTS